ncbi:hypothetical protein LLEC1_02922 [Akanthomyces lecanii]|uniref:ABC transporter domain-containing protein n=1 Tax=Cordyceps confragosa TaxID=2714763 RepID=A0A179IKC3_CORDF|nr:hypothetical protein LLEC1_02922 [Akanthomyces lecanii]
MAVVTADSLFWDPLVSLFDFTLRFEEIILQLIPSALAIGACSVWYNRYRHEPVYIRSSPLLWAKIIAVTALVVFQAASLSLRAKLVDSLTSTSIPASTLELVALLAVAGVMYMGHMHSIRSSGLLALYLIFTLLVDVVKSRSYFLRPEMGTLGGLNAATAVLRLTLLLLEEKSKRFLIIDKEVRDFSGREATSGYLTRAFMLFLNPMFIVGYYHKLENDDLMRLGLDFSSKKLHTRFKKQWAKRKEKPTRYCLLFACLHTWRWELLQLLFPRLCYVGFSFAQPFLMQRVIDTVEENGHDENGEVKLPPSTGEKLGLQAATVFVFVGMAQSKTTSQHMTNRLMTQVRGGLVAELMEKTHYLSEQEAKKSSVLTHMSSDIESISEGLGGCVDIPITVLQTCLGVYFLSRLIGVSCFFVLIPIAITACFSYLLGRKTGPAMAEWNKAIETRISKTNEILSQLPGIKMCGLGPTMRNVIHSLRVQEMETSKKYRFFMTLVNATQQFVDLGTPVVVVAAAFFLSGFDHKMSSTQVFPTLAVVSLIQGPMQKILEIYSEVCAMVACFDRIQTFLLLAERKDSRVKWDPSAPPEVFDLVPTHFGSTVMRRRPQGPSPGGIIQFDSASFGPIGMENPLLCDIQFSLLRGSITGVYGGTGCGKSTLFRSLLGETKNAGGYVYTDNVDIAYCSSQVWLRDASIRENVIGCLAYDPVRYDIAIQSCQLEQDLARLPGRDAYVVGPNGFNLSGGQRHRVALARAVFAHCAITIIDDCFSALDAQTARAIIDALCGPNGALRRAGSTVLMATYLPESLQVIDQMISFDGEGGASLDRVEFRDPLLNRQISNFLSTLQSTAPQEEENREIDAIRRSWPEDFEVPSAAEQDYIRQRGSWGLYLIFIDSIGRIKCAWFSFMAFLLAGTELLPPIYMRAWVEKGPENGLWFLGYAVMAATACGLMAIAYWLLYSFFAVRAAVGLHEQILNVVMRATFGFLTSTNTGNLLNRFSQDSNLFARVLPYYLFRTMYMFYEAAIVIGIILSSASYMSIALPAIVLSIALIQRFYLRTSRQIRHIDLEEKAPLYTFFVETSEGILYIQAFAWQEKNMERGYRLLDNSQKPYYLMLCIQQWLTLVLGLLAAGVALVLVSVVVWVRKGTSGPAVGLAFLGIISFQLVMMELIQAWTGSETSVAGLGRLEQFTADTPQESKPDSPTTVSTNWPLVGDVQLTSVSARYKPALDIPPITRDVSLAIEAGEKIAIIGRTGSGKSTLLLALLGLVQYDGKVELDGVDITTVDLDLLRSRVVTISQEPLQFNDTIRTNLLPFTMDEEKSNDERELREKVATDAMLQNTLSRLGIWSKLNTKGGLDAMLSNVGYSKGEIQLLSIARAIARRHRTGSSIILVDEATSNLDPERDVATQSIMREAFRGCTVITVAHRQEARQNIDCSIELVDGRVAGILHYHRIPTPAPSESSTEAASSEDEEEEEEEE